MPGTYILIKVIDTVSVKQNVQSEIRSNFFPRWPFGCASDMLQIWFARSFGTIGDAFRARAASLGLHSPSGRVFETGKFARGRRWL